MTNADMIRAMSDEELAEIFCAADWCNACGQLKQDGTCHAMEMGGPLHPYCKAGCLTWLRQSAVEEDISLAKAETCPAGSTIEFEITCLDKNLENMVVECLNYGSMRGLGQWRNSGKGVFTWEKAE